jgi:L-arabinokinase
MLVAYVSGHGYGHATRVGEVLRAVREWDPRLPITVVSSAPAALFRRVVPDVEIRAVSCDLGIVQKDALTIDEGATAAAWRAFRSETGDLVDAEWRFLRHSGARLVLGDIPPVAFDAAGEAGVPSVGLANFSWDWVYGHMAPRHRTLVHAADWARAAYRRAALLLRLPFSGDLSAFSQIVDIPLIARRPRVPKAEARKRLGLGGGTVALVTFGGLGLPSLDARVLAQTPDVEFVGVDTFAAGGRNARAIASGALEDLGLAYEDVVGAADVVVTKPGYGIVSDAIGAGTRIVYTDRGNFPEYPILVSGMSRCIPATHVSNADLLAGRLREPIAKVLAMPVPPPPDLSGAAVAARHLMAVLSAA